MSKGDFKLTQKQYSRPPEMVIDKTLSYKAHIELEKGGIIVIDLMVNEAPKTVNNFVLLAKEKYYD